MRKELYTELTSRLHRLCVNAAGEYYVAPAEIDEELCNRAIKHIDLWNRNVEFIEQEMAWERPAVFIEFVPFKWTTIVTGVEYRATPLINLHVVTDWTSGHDVEAFELLDKIHECIAGIEGKSFMDFDIYESCTNHNHEDIVENIETYTCVGVRHLEKNN